MKNVLPALLTTAALLFSSPSQAQKSVKKQKAPIFMGKIEGMTYFVQKHQDVDVYLLDAHRRIHLAHNKKLGAFYFASNETFDVRINADSLEQFLTPSQHRQDLFERSMPYEDVTYIDNAGVGVSAARYALSGDTLYFFLDRDRNGKLHSGIDDVQHVIFSNGTVVDGGYLQGGFKTLKNIDPLSQPVYPFGLKQEDFAQNYKPQEH